MKKSINVIIAISIMIISIIIIILILLGKELCSSILNPNKDLVYISEKTIRPPETGSETSWASEPQVIFISYTTYLIRNDGTIYNNDSMKEIGKFDTGELLILKSYINKVKLYIQICDIQTTDTTSKDEIIIIKDKKYALDSLPNTANKMCKKIQEYIKKEI